MNTRKLRMAALVLAAGLSGAAQAALQGRDLNGSIDSFEAYYDTDLNITWLADANYAQTSGYDADGLMTWSQANTWATTLSIVDSVNNIHYDKWRLPDINAAVLGASAVVDNPNSELAYMFYVNLGNNTSGALNTGPFTNLLHPELDLIPYAYPNLYWLTNETLTTSEMLTLGVPGFAIDRGMQGMEFGWGLYPENEFFAWAVRDGDVAAVPEPETYAMFFAGLGLVGAIARRRKQAKI